MTGGIPGPPSRRIFTRAGLSHLRRRGKREEEGDTDPEGDAGLASCCAASVHNRIAFGPAAG